MIPEFTQEGKTLIIFDFDHTMIDVNSDTWIPKELCPTSDYFDLKAGSASRQCYDKNGWTRLCHEFFEKAHKDGISKI